MSDHLDRLKGMLLTSSLMETASAEPDQTTAILALARATAVYAALNFAEDSAARETVRAVVIDAFETAFTQISNDLPAIRKLFS
jgi:hypothetical protein